MSFRGSAIWRTRCWELLKGFIGIYMATELSICSLIFSDFVIDVSSTWAYLRHVLRVFLIVRLHLKLDALDPLRTLLPPGNYQVSFLLFGECFFYIHGFIHWDLDFISRQIFWALLRPAFRSGSNRKSGTIRGTVSTFFKAPSVIFLCGGAFWIT